MDGRRDVRTHMLEAAERLLDESPTRDIATRAVCDAVGVGIPVLYRLFGDKNGLLKAVVDYGFERYLEAKRAALPSGDPVADLRNGWDRHVAFALEHPAVYRLMYSPNFSESPSTASEALGVLRGVLVRCAAAGRLRVEPDRAARVIMSANIGLALSLVTQPHLYADPGLSVQVRDAVHASLLKDDAAPGPAAGPDDATSMAAIQLSAALESTTQDRLTAPETTLLLQWLTRLTSDRDGQDSRDGRGDGDGDGDGRGDRDAGGRRGGQGDRGQGGQRT